MGLQERSEIFIRVVVPTDVGVQRRDELVDGRRTPVARVEQQGL